ncbi:DUF1775 domain-containing protein [Neoaquamicrobium sediminum]|uniref:DUF1775 domain-containing protein n=1 Tax=Neoaquamicrobium sediminum TaxID=1849104 RepID=UPI0035E3F6A3
MRHLMLQFAAASALTAFSVATAYAHASLETANAAPGSYKAVVRIPHGCEGQATHTVRVEVPEGYVGVKPMPKAGWTLAVDSGDYQKSYNLHGREVSSGTKAVTWSGGSLEDGHYDEFVLSGSLAGVEEGQKLFFVTTQTCADGEVKWNEIPAEGEDPHALAHPAPGLTILAAEGGHDHAGHGGGGERAVVAGDLEITAAWARAMLPGQPAGGGYLTIANKGDEADRLVGASASAADRVEIHTMEVVDDVMVMRPVEGALEIPAGETVELKPGGLHIMFLDVSDPFREGGTVAITLEFEKAGSVDVGLPVRSARGGDGGGHHKH